ncbi:MAG: FAD-linked oxidase C-terminal domain-containing protein [Gammaproteobacteria bacterium]|nr:FAD-linked oxidase C-terminal domain-containing protein [Gammaproteobacteria bacterium]
MTSPPPEPSPDFAASGLLRELAAVLDAGALITEQEARAPYECDGLSAYRQVPPVVARPADTDQVREVMRICRRHGVPVVARGAGTGLSGGALPHPGAVLLSLARLDEVLEVDPLNRTARVQPGVRNLAISEAGAPHGLYYAPDPSSQIACTIGGNVAENAGGVHCLKYGLTVHNILEVKVVTADGDLLTIGSPGPDSPGYDLLALMTGSEGLLAIVVEATVRLLPRPTARQVLMGAFARVGDAGTAVARIIGDGIIPAGLEMMDNPAIRAAEDFVHAGYPVDAAAILLCELDGAEDEVAELTARTVALLEDCGASEVRVAADEADAETLWRGRKAAFPAVGRISPDYYCMDGTIPRKHLSRVLAEIAVLSGEFGLAVANVFHAGDGNLHPLILYDANQPGELARAEAFGGRILELCVAVGGTITGEHGVGFEKLDQMCTQFQKDELTQFHAIKAAFDPDGLLNPGKAVPTLHRCAELGAMHVHKGQLPFPELDRF